MHTKQLPSLILQHDEAERSIKRMIDEGIEIKQQQISNLDSLETARSDKVNWNKENYEIIGRMFTDTTYAEEYMEAKVLRVFFLDGPEEPLQNQVQEFRENVQK